MRLGHGVLKRGRAVWPSRAHTCDTQVALAVYNNKVSFDMSLFLLFQDGANKVTLLCFIKSI